MLDNTHFFCKKKKKKKEFFGGKIYSVMIMGNNAYDKQ